MSWMFHSFGGRASVREYHDVISKVDAFWDTVTASAVLRRQPASSAEARELADKMRAWIRLVHPRLSVGIYATEGEAHIFVVSPGAAVFLWPLAEFIQSRAPERPGWTFECGVPASSWANTCRYLAEEFGVDVTRTELAISVTDLNSIAIDVIRRDRKRISQTLTPEILRVLLAHWLGERRRDTWIEVASTRDEASIDERIAVTGEGLQAAVDAEIVKLDSTLPDQPLFELDATARPTGLVWTEAPRGTEMDSASNRQQVGSVFQLEPVEADDYPEWHDFAVGSALYERLWVAEHTVPDFSSRRFSKKGELFCYLKLDGTEGLARSASFKDRGDIEDGLNDALIRNAAGVVTGGGTGLKYSYIDLAIMDIWSAAQIVREVLQPEMATNRIWLLFFEAALKDQWIGIYEDTPGPPTKESTRMIGDGGTNGAL